MVWLVHYNTRSKPTYYKNKVVHVGTHPYSSKSMEGFVIESGLKDLKRFNIDKLFKGEGRISESLLLPKTAAQRNMHHQRTLTLVALITHHAY
jgi:hypothetical protein